VGEAARGARFEKDLAYARLDAEGHEAICRS
jgi:hypothetical protein